MSIVKITEISSGIVNIYENVISYDFESDPMILEITVQIGGNGDVNVQRTFPKSEYTAEIIEEVIP